MQFVIGAGREKGIAGPIEVQKWPSLGEGVEGIAAAEQHAPDARPHVHLIFGKLPFAVALLGVA